MEVKNSLLMPKTNFQMRGNLSQREPEVLKKWEELDLYNLIIERNKDKPHFILHDGPPYANGDIHIGHALNKILKDFVVRYKNMSGFYSPYIPGWDTHGLPIESVLARKGVKRKEMDIATYRNMCSDYALEQVAIQKQEFIRLGSIGDYSNPYITLDKKYEAIQIELFSKMALDGLIYKGKKPVFWSPSSETALAEAEIEYHDIVSDSIYIGFKVVDGKGKVDSDTSFLIWTTTPWTMPGNLAISLNPNLKYGLYNTNKGKVVFNVDLEEELKEKLLLTEVELLKTFLGSELEHIKTKHPLYDRFSPIILGEHVTNESGTGCVHTAPGHGEDDFIVGQKYNLGILSPVNDRGLMTSEAGEDLEGMFYAKANEKIIEMLEAKNAVYGRDKITHSYPHDWRTKQPIIYRVTEQWFASIEPIREKLLEEIKKVTWYPSWGEVRLSNMIKDRGDWCISRQRVWGVPIPIIYGEDEKPIMDKVLFDHFKGLFNEHGSNVWFSSDVNDLLPKGYTHHSSPNNIFTKESDIMDVWFDSGTSHTAGLINTGIDYPVDLYLEGSDQYRGWFNSSLTIGTAARGKSPYRAVVTHGFALDGRGNKMSKSQGNVVEPKKVISQYGADILRLWVASVNYQADVRISDNILKQVSEMYRKIRNTFRFLLGNLVKSNEGYFDYEKDKVTEFSQIDAYLLNRLNIVTNMVLDYYDEYDFSSVVTTLMNFMTNDLSAFYLDYTKDILYCEHEDSLRRRQVQTTIYLILENLMPLFAPILPFTLEDVYDNLQTKKEKSVHLLSMPKRKDADTKLDEEFEELLTLRDEALKELEGIRVNHEIGSSQEASLEITINDEKLLKAFNRLPKVEQTRFFIVSDLNVVSDKTNDKKTFVKAFKNDGEKCVRCWNRYPKLNEEELCERCEVVMESLRDK